MTKAASSTAAVSNQPKDISWAPDHDDHFIYWWVKLEGNTQTYVASQLGISQGTISRTIKRYERWQTRAEAAVDGRLDHAERLRAQQWLTYERNELILASCLRIAGAMEGWADVTKSTYLRPLASDKPGNGDEIRTEQKEVDRHGLAARFLRLAYRINMDQLKLAEQAEQPPLPPLTPEQLAEEEASAAATRDELRRARQDAAERVAQMRQPQQPPAAAYAQQQAEIARLKQIEEAERLALAKEILAAGSQGAGIAGEDTGGRKQESVCQGAHNAYNDGPLESSANQEPPSTCGKNGRPKKSPEYARMNGSAHSRRSSKAARNSRDPEAPAVAEVRLSREEPVAIQSG